MDFETLVWILLLLLPVIGRLFGKNKPAEDLSPEGTPPAQASWNDAMSELRAAMEGGTVPEPEPVPVSTVPRAKLERALAPAEPPHYFAEPSYDDRFEAKPRFSEPKHRELHLKHPAPLALPPPRRRISAEAVALRRQLHNKRRLGEAFVLAEVIGPPRSKRPFRRR